MTLLTHPDWKALIQIAENRSAIQLTPRLENYLSDLIQRFSTDPHLAEEAMAMGWLKAVSSAEGERYLRIGDECLLLAGLFPDYLTRRTLTLDYFIRLGRSAYGAISHHATDLYGVLSSQFVVLMDVLYYVRDVPPLLPYEAYQRFRATGSEHAKRVLASHEGIIPFKALR